MQLVQALIWILGAVLIIAALLDRSLLLQLSGCGPSESVQTFTEGVLVMDIFENTDIRGNLARFSHQASIG